MVSRNFAFKFIALGLLVTSFATGLLFGPGNSSQFDVLEMVNKLVLGGSVNSDPTLLVILKEIRLPRVLSALVVGFALGVAGALSQGLFRNALASPSILGTTSAASAFAALAFYFVSQLGSVFVIPIAAFFGASMCCVVILGISRTLKSHKNIDILLLVGVALGSFFAAVTSLVISLLTAEHQRLGHLFYWLLGGLNGRTWDHLSVGFPPFVFAMLIAYFLPKKLDLLAFGSDFAQSKATNINGLMRTTCICISLLVGASTSIAGAVPFLGLVVPHFTRIIFGARHRTLVLFSGINGATLLMAADFAGRSFFAPREVEVGIIMALLGAPYFLLVLIKRGKYLV